MTDVTTLAGLNVGAQVLHLASNLLRSGLMTEGPQRFSGLPDGGGADRSKKDHDAVMARINGEFACTHLSVQQRYEGADVDRMLRRPFAILESELLESARFSASFFKHLSAMTTLPYHQPTTSRGFPVLVFSHKDAYLKFLREHVQRSVPPVFSTTLLDPSTVSIFYLGASEKLTYLLLLLQTKTVRAAFALELTYPLLRPSYSGDDPFWLRADTILLSTRVMLLPFTRWLSAGKAAWHAMAPSASSFAYLPTAEDNCALTAPFGRSFDALIPVEIIQARLHDKSTRFANVRDTFTVTAALQDIHSEYIAVVILFMYYKFMVWSLEDANKDVRVGYTFLQFVRIAAPVLVLPDSEWETSIPAALFAVRTVFSELREVFTTGMVNTRMTSFFSKYARHQSWQPAGPISGDRTMLGLLQIALVLEERAAQSLPYNPEVVAWTYTPLRVLMPGQVQAYLLHSSPALNVPAETYGFVIENCNSELLQAALKPVLTSFAEMDLTHFAAFRFDVQYADVTHAVLTRSECMCLAITNKLTAMKIYMSVCSLMKPNAAPMDLQTVFFFIGALLRGGNNLFHWLHAFRVLLRGPPKAIPPSAAIGLEQLDLDLAQSTAEKPDERIKALLTRMCILCKQGFLTPLLEAACTLQDDNCDGTVVSVLLRCVITSMCDTIVLTPRSFKRMHLLDDNFVADFLDSHEYSNWSDKRQAWFAEYHKDLTATLDPSSDAESDFQSPPFLYGEPEMQDIVEDEQLPAEMKLDEALLLVVYQRIAVDVQEGRLEQAIRKMVQLKGRTTLKESYLKKVMPILFYQGGSGKKFQVSELTVSPEFVNYDNFLHPPKTVEVQPHAVSFVPVCDHFGLQCVMNQSTVSAFLDQRMFVNGRSSAEILVPQNHQHNMYTMGLAEMSARLVSQLLGAKQNELLQPVRATGQRLSQHMKSVQSSRKSRAEPAAASASSAKAPTQAASKAKKAKVETKPADDEGERKSPEAPEAEPVPNDDDEEYDPDRPGLDNKPLTAKENAKIAKISKNQPDWMQNRDYEDFMDKDPEQYHNEQEEAARKGSKRKHEEEEQQLYGYEY